MVSARRAMCGALIFLLGSYLFFLKNDAFSIGLLSQDAYNISYYYLTFALLAGTVVAGFLLSKDLMAGSIIAICCISVVMVWNVTELLEGWSGGPYTFEENIRHLHRIIRDIIIPCCVLVFGIIGIGRGAED